MPNVDCPYPYVGWRPYGTRDRGIFYGRSAASRDLADLCAGRRVVVVHGPAGVGKTSLVQAGAVPLLRDAGAEVLPFGRVSRRPSVPAAALPEHNPYTFALLSSCSPADRPSYLASISVAEFLRRRVEAAEWSHAAAAAPTVAVVDRFDDIFAGSGHGGSDRYEFFDQLADAMELFPGFRLVVCARDESLPSLTPFMARLDALSPAMFKLSPLAPEDAFQAVVAPLAGSSRSFSVSAAENLVRDIRTEIRIDASGDRTPVLTDMVEPVLLQVVCHALWQALPAEATVIGTDEVRRHGGVDAALGAFFDAALADVADTYGMRESRLRLRLEEAAWPERAGQVHMRVPAAQRLPGHVVRALVDRHVVRVQPYAGSPAPEPAGSPGTLELLSRRFVLPLKEEPGQVRVARPSVGVDSQAAFLQSAEEALADNQLALAERQANRVLAEPVQADARVVGRAQTLLGDVAFFGGRLDEAGDRYLRAAEIFEEAQDHAAVGWLLAAAGRLLLEKGEYASAAARFEAAVQRLPGDLAIKIDLARALRSSGNLRAAAAWFGSVLTIAPDTVEALAGRGEIRAALHDYSDALNDLDNALRLKPGIGYRPTVRDARALALTGLADSGERAASRRR